MTEQPGGHLPEADTEGHFKYDTDAEQAGTTWKATSQSHTPTPSGPKATPTPKAIGECLREGMLSGTRTTRTRKATGASTADRT